MPELVIFDCDGVLVDTEPIANRVLAELLTAEGLPTTTEESVARYLGLSMPAALALAAEALGRPLPPALLDAYDQGIHAAFEEELTQVEGAAAAVDRAVALGLRTCVASSGSHGKIRHTLGLTGLLSRFEGRIFSAADVARGKPFPDLFLHAAAALGVAPAACVVVEDSPAGVQAARAAGMTVFGLAGLAGSEPLVAAGAVPLGSMAELGPVLEAALGTR